MLHIEKFSENLHMNADSWRVFGDVCRSLLERLAFEEPDLMKVSFLIFLRLVFFLCASEGRITPSSSRILRPSGK